MPKTLLCCLLSGALAIFTVSAQEYYRWQDKSGQLHVSQIPPPAGVDYQIVSMQAKGAVTEVKAPVVSTPKESTPAVQNPVAELNKQVEAMNAQVRQHNCKQAQINQQRLTEEAVLMVTGDDGKSVELTAEMRAEQLEVAEKQIKEFCQQ